MWMLAVGLLIFSVAVLASGALLHGAAVNERDRARLNLHGAGDPRARVS